MTAGLVSVSERPLCRKDREQSCRNARRDVCRRRCVVSAFEQCRAFRRECRERGEAAAESRANHGERAWTERAAPRGNAACGRKNEAARHVD